MVDPENEEADEGGRCGEREGGGKVAGGPPGAQADAAGEQPLGQEELQVPSPARAPRQERQDLERVAEAGLPLTQEGCARRIVPVPQGKLSVAQHGAAFDGGSRKMVPKERAHVRPVRLGYSPDLGVPHARQERGLAVEEPPHEARRRNALCGEDDRVVRADGSQERGHKDRPLGRGACAAPERPRPLGEAHGPGSHRPFSGKQAPHEDREHPGDCPLPAGAGEGEGPLDADGELRIGPARRRLDVEPAAPDLKELDLVHRPEGLRREGGRDAPGPVDDTRVSKGQVGLPVKRIEPQAPDRAVGQGEPEERGMARLDRLDRRVVLDEVRPQLVVELDQSRMVGLDPDLERARAHLALGPRPERDHGGRGQDEACGSA